MRIGEGFVRIKDESILDTFFDHELQVFISIFGRFISQCYLININRTEQQFSRLVTKSCHNRS